MLISHSTSGRREAVAAILLALAWAVVLYASGYAIDDTYIHLQFARNLFAGDGFRFWPGDAPVYGCTSPAWATLLAVSAWLPVDPLAFARGLSILFGLLGAWALTRLGDRSDSSMRRWAPALLLLVNPWWVRWSASGMEATAGAFLAVVVWRLSSNDGWSPRRQLGVGLLCGIGFLARPELVLLAPVVVFVRWISDDGAMRNRLIAAACVLAPWGIVGLCWAAFAQWHFGQIAPNAVAAKASEAGLIAGVWTGARRLATLVALSDAPLVCALIAALFVARRAFAAVESSDRRRLLFAIVWPGAVIAFLLTGGAPMISRYPLIAWPCLTWLGWRALMALADRLSTSGSRSASRAVVRTPFVWAIAAGAVVVYPHMLKVANNLPVYESVAEYLRDETPADAVIAVHEIGVFGYYGERRLLDLGGLVSPQVNERPSRGEGEYLTVSLSFLHEQAATHYIDPNEQVAAFQADGGSPLARLTELESWEFKGGAGLSDRRKSYTRRLYVIDWSDESGEHSRPIPDEEPLP